MSEQMPNQVNTSWTPERRAWALYLSASGVAPRAISERLGCTRNAVIGMVDRDRRKRGGAPAYGTPSTSLHDRLARYTTDGCRWFDGDPRRGSKACGAKTLPGKAYCAAHYKRVYLKLPEPES